MALRLTSITARPFILISADVNPTYEKTRVRLMVQLFHSLHFITGNPGCKSLYDNRGFRNCITTLAHDPASDPHIFLAFTALGVINVSIVNKRMGKY